MQFDARTGRGAERQRLRDRTTERPCGSPHTTVVRVRGCNDGTSAYAIRLQVSARQVARQGGYAQVERVACEARLKVLS